MFGYNATAIRGLTSDGYTPPGINVEGGIAGATLDIEQTADNTLVGYLSVVGTNSTALTVHATGAGSDAIIANGATRLNGGFSVWGAPFPSSRPSIGGSRAAMGTGVYALITALATYGIVNDSTTA